MTMTKAQQQEAARLLELIASEFISDPMSVQCFDITAIVKPVIKLAEELSPHQGRRNQETT